MTTDVLIRKAAGWSSIFAGAVPDSVRVKTPTGFPSVVGLNDPPGPTKFIRNLAGDAWIPLDAASAIAPTYRNHRSSDPVSGGSIGVTAPNGTLATDIQIIACQYADTSTTVNQISQPPDTTLLHKSPNGSRPHVMVVWKIGNSSTTFGWGGSNVFRAAFAMSAYGQHAVTPIAGFSVDQGSTSSPSAPSLIPTADKWLAISGLHIRYGTNVMAPLSITGLAGWQEEGKTGSSGTTDTSFIFGRNATLDTGSTGDCNYSMSNSTDNTVWQVAIAGE